MKTKLIAIVLLLALPFTVFAATARSIKAEVNGMVCAFCAEGIEKKLRAQDAVKDVYVNLEKKVVAVELKDGKDLSPEKITADIKEAGYDVRTIKRIDAPLSEIKAGLK